MSSAESRLLSLSCLLQYIPPQVTLYSTENKISGIFRERRNAPSPLSQGRDMTFAYAAIFRTYIRSI